VFLGQIGHLPCRDSHASVGGLSEPPIEWDDESALILALMRIEAKLDELLRLFAEEDDGEEEEPDA
jgi:hypothetical protein